MNILALDTATSIASIALTTESGTVAEQSFCCQRALSSRLVQEVEHLLTLAGTSLRKIDLFAVGLGPGSFTGVRCGVSVTQGFALATGKPAVGFSSLAALAMNFPYSTNPVCALFDARKNELYGGLYDCISGTPVPMLAETVLPAEQFMQLVTSRTGSPLIIAGEGVVRYQETLATLLGERARIAPTCHNTVRAANGALLAYNCYQKQGAGALSSLLPHYIRPSDAEIARLAKIVTHE